MGMDHASIMDIAMLAIDRLCAEAYAAGDPVMVEHCQLAREGHTESLKAVADAMRPVHPAMKDEGASR